MSCGQCLRRCELSWNPSLTSFRFTNMEINTDAWLESGQVPAGLKWMLTEINSERQCLPLYKGTPPNLRRLLRPLSLRKLSSNKLAMDQDHHSIQCNDVWKGRWKQKCLGRMETNPPTTIASKETNFRRILSYVLRIAMNIKAQLSKGGNYPTRHSSKVHNRQKV